VSGLLFSVGLSLFLFAIVLLVLLLNERRSQHRRLREEHRKALGLPIGELVYEDVDGQSEPLVSSEYPLAGRPDYVVLLPDGRPVPVVLKLTVQNVVAPYSNHMIQLTAYCLILEEYFEIAPTHGLLRYADREFTVEYTPALRKKVIRFLNEMARCSQQQPPPLKRQRVGKCRACVFQPTCPVGRGK